MMEPFYARTDDGERISARLFSLDTYEREVAAGVTPADPTLLAAVAIDGGYTPADVGMSDEDIVTTPVDGVWLIRDWPPTAPLAARCGAATA